MNSISTIGVIKVKDKYNITYSLCEIEYIINEDESYKFIFKPNYNIIDLTDSSFFQGIPGLNLDLREEKYIRENMMPTFISERCPMKNRENLYEELNDAGLDYFNPLQWLINSDLKYSGDNLFVEAKEEILYIELDNSKLNKNINQNIKKILDYICQGYKIKYNCVTIDDYNRKEIYCLLKNLYHNSYYFYKDKTNKVGRKKKNIDTLYFKELIEKYKNDNITVNEIIKKLNISRSTFYRLLRKHNILKSSDKK